MTADVVTCLFERDRDDRYVPTAAARGPWHQSVLHGGAVSALLAGLLEHPDQVLVRILIELLAPVPNAPLRVETSGVEGGRRVMRQTADLYADDRAVARACALRMRSTDLALPASATAHRTVFDPALSPELDAPNRRARDIVGWESFDSLAMAAHAESKSDTGRRRMWMRLLVPVVSGRPPSAVENVVAGADYGSSGTYARLDFDSWTFMNADLVVTFCRRPVGDWVGLESEGLLSPTGTGLSVASLYDERGPLGQSSQSTLIEPRTR